MPRSALAHCLEAGIVGVAILTAYCALTTPTVLCVAALAVLWGVYRRERRRAAGTIPLTGKYVLITGCDSGFGYELAKHLHELGCHVIATVLLPEGKGAQKLRDVSSPRMTVLPLDVSSDESVSECLRTVKTIYSDTGLWGLVNNAGVDMVGDVEMVTMRQYLHAANVNIFGMVRTTRAFLPLLRQAKGRIVNVTSVHGRISMPRRSAYSLTKFAAETFSDITRLEMSQFGVKVIIIEPGAFGPPSDARSILLERMRKNVEEMWREASDEVRELHGRQLLDEDVDWLRKLAESSQPSALKTDVIAAMTEALTSSDPEIRYLVDGPWRKIDTFCWMVRIKPFIPDRLLHWWTAYQFCHLVRNRHRHR